MSARLALLLAAALALSGCWVDADRPERRSRQGLASPWPEDGAPTALLALADDLEAFAATGNALPAALSELDRANLATGGPYSGAKARAYVYHPAGIGVLKDGWRILAADDRTREPGGVWCVVRPPVRVSGTPALRVVRVPLPELEVAAANAGR